MRRMIMDAALELFVRKGFDETTIDEIAEAAGISRRSFFRYFANKDDLLAHEVVTYGLVLSEAIASCPGDYSPAQVLQETVLRLAASAETQPNTRSTIHIVERSSAARQAQSSGLPEAQERVAEAYAKRLKTNPRKDVRPQILASLTFSVIDVAVRAWYRGAYKDLQSATKDALLALGSLVGGEEFAATTNPQPSAIELSRPSTAKQKTNTRRPPG
jgi:AcrR family transcriptional regulator